MAADFLLSSQLDPIGDQNDVQYVSTNVNSSFIFDIFGTSPNYDIYIYVNTNRVR